MISSSNSLCTRMLCLSHAAKGKYRRRLEGAQKAETRPSQSTTPFACALERSRSGMMFFSLSLFRFVSGSGRNEISAAPGGLEILFRPSGCWARTCGPTRTPSSSSASRPVARSFVLAISRVFLVRKPGRAFCFWGVFLRPSGCFFWGSGVFWSVFVVLFGFSGGACFFFLACAALVFLRLLLHRTSAMPVLRPRWRRESYPVRPGSRRLGGGRAPLCPFQA